MLTNWTDWNLSLHEAISHILREFAVLTKSYYRTHLLHKKSPSCPECSRRKYNNQWRDHKVQGNCMDYHNLAPTGRLDSLFENINHDVEPMLTKLSYSVNHAFNFYRLRNCYILLFEQLHFIVFLFFRPTFLTSDPHLAWHTPGSTVTSDTITGPQATAVFLTTRAPKVAWTICQLIYNNRYITSKLETVANQWRKQMPITLMEMYYKKLVH